MTNTRDGRDIVERLRHAPVVFGTEMFGATRLLEDAASEIERLRSQRVAVPEGWQDISTAPKDQTVDGVVDGEVRLIRWCKASHVPFHGWCVVDQGAEDSDLCMPTHWMPLPAPPGASTLSPTDTLSSAVEEERARVSDDAMLAARKGGAS